MPTNKNHLRTINSCNMTANRLQKSVSPFSCHEREWSFTLKGKQKNRRKKISTLKKMWFALCSLKLSTSWFAWTCMALRYYLLINASFGVVWTNAKIFINKVSLGSSPELFFCKLGNLWISKSKSDKQILLIWKMLSLRAWVLCRKVFVVKSFIKVKFSSFTTGKQNSLIH